MLAFHPVPPTTISPSPSIQPALLSLTFVAAHTPLRCVGQRFIVPQPSNGIFSQWTASAYFSLAPTTPASNSTRRWLAGDDWLQHCLSTYPVALLRTSGLAP